MKNCLRSFLLTIVAIFAFGITASTASAQDMPGMPGMKMSKPKPKPKPKAKLKAKAKPKAKAKAKPKAKPAAKPMMDMSMPGMKMTNQPQAPKSNESPTPMDMPMTMPMATPTPSASPMPMDMPMNLPMPVPSTTPLPMPAPKTGKPVSLETPKDFPKPVDDTMPYLFVMADLLEFRPKGSDSDFRWDVEGWYGGDYNRFWFKSEGERNTAFKADYDIDLQLLYGRFIKRYYDFQIGARFETQKFRNVNVTRPQLSVGIQGLVPYRYEVEAAMFVDPRGNVSARFEAERDYLLTQRLVLQPRIETSLAIQRVERFTTGRGLNNIEAGARLRYDVSRKFAPYIGVSFEKSFFETATLVRADGGDPSQIRFAAGVRLFY